MEDHTHSGPVPIAVGILLVFNVLVLLFIGGLIRRVDSLEKHISAMEQRCHRPHLPLTPRPVQGP